MHIWYPAGVSHIVLTDMLSGDGAFTGEVQIIGGASLAISGKTFLLQVFEGPSTANGEIVIQYKADAPR